MSQRFWCLRAASERTYGAICSSNRRYAARSPACAWAMRMDQSRSRGPAFADALSRSVSAESGAGAPRSPTSISGRGCLRASENMVEVRTSHAIEWPWDCAPTPAFAHRRRVGACVATIHGCRLRLRILLLSFTMRNLLPGRSELSHVGLVPGAITCEVRTMNRSLIAASALSTAIGLALATSALPAQAQGKMDMSKAPQIVKDNMARMEKNKLEKCYGINAVAKNDCAEGAHS